MIDKKVRDVLKNYTVGIAGVGGLGSNCGVALARIGIGRLVVADYDVVELSNLNRQYYFYDQIGMPKVEAFKDNIYKIDKQIKVDVYNVKLSKENILAIYKDVDIMVEAFDKAEMKLMLIEEVLMNMSDKYIISGSGLAGWGNNDTITTKQYDKLIICGDGITEVNDDNPPLAPRVGIVANMQANIVVELIMKGKI